MTKEEIFNLLKSNSRLLKKYKVKSIGLFGSFVRNEQNEKSDIDFLIEFAEPTYDNLINLKQELEAIFDRRVEIISSGGISPYIEPYIQKEIEKIEV